MSSDVPRNICPEARDGHSFQEDRNVAVLKCNSELGCQLCSLIYHGLESLHGPWFKKHEESIKFCRFSSLTGTLRIDIFQDPAPASGTGVIFTEFAYEVDNLR
jgi:hypothetical protein